MNSNEKSETKNISPADPFKGYEQVISALGFGIHFVFLFISIASIPVYLAVLVPVLKMTTPWYFITMRCVAFGLYAVYFMTSMVWSGFLAPFGTIYNFIPLYVAYALELFTVSCECYLGIVHPLIFLADFIFQAALNFSFCYIGSQNDLEEGYWCKFKVYTYKRISPKMTIQEARNAFKIRVSDGFGVKIYVYQNGYFRLFSDEFGLIQN